MTEELNLFPMDGELPLKTQGFKVSSLKNLPEVIVLYVGDTVCASKTPAMTCFSTSPFKQNPERWGQGQGGEKGESCFWWYFACTEKKLHSHTQAAPSSCVLLHKHNSVHVGIHWLKYMQKAVLGTASLCFTHE